MSKIYSWDGVKIKVGDTVRCYHDEDMTSEFVVTKEDLSFYMPQEEKHLQMSWKIIKSA